MIGGSGYTIDTSFADGHGYPIPLGRMTDHNRANLTASSFTWRNQGAATIADHNGGVVLTIPDEASWKLRGLTISAPGTPYAVTARMRIALAPGEPIGLNSTHAGLWIRENSTGELLTLSCRVGQSFAMWEWTDWNTWSATVDTSWAGYNTMPWIWLRLEDDGTDHKGYYSLDGSNWSQDGSSWFQQSRTAHMASGGDQIGFYLNSGTNSGNTTTGPATCTVWVDCFNVEQL